MTSIPEIQAICQLGDFFKHISSDNAKDTSNLNIKQQHFEDVRNFIDFPSGHNPWFTTADLKFTIKYWAENLNQPTIERWLAKYQVNSTNGNKTVGLVMAGNLPMVGFHDLICGLLAGFRVKVKCSSDDNYLIPKIQEVLFELNPEVGSRIEFTDSKLENVDAVIATGSNNTSRYFEYYFRDIPHIIRRNRNGIAVLDGNESEQELLNLGEDVFRYFGKGCRSISKIYIPENFDLDRLFNAFYPQHEMVMAHNKYMNNYDYHRALYMMNQDDLLENGFLIVKEDTAIASPLAVLFYEKYKDANALLELLKEQSEQIQCIVSNIGSIENKVSFGQAQSPKLWDYADGVDTMKFLTSL